MDNKFIDSIENIEIVAYYSYIFNLDLGSVIVSKRDDIDIYSFESSISLKDFLFKNQLKVKKVGGHIVVVKDDGVLGKLMFSYKG